MYCEKWFAAWPCRLLASVLLAEEGMDVRQALPPQVDMEERFALCTCREMLSW